MKSWRNAASLMVAVRSRGISPTESVCLRDTDYKLLALRRHGQSSFLPKSIVFPGGTVSEVDHTSSWDSLFKKVLGKDTKEILNELKYPCKRFPIAEDNMHWQVHPDVALRICAIRETFEESGILIGINKQEYDRIPRDATVNTLSCSMSLGRSTCFESWRGAIHKDPYEFVRLCSELEIVPNLWALLTWNNWLTPEGNGNKRFDTIFYMSCFDGDSFPCTYPDQSEITEATWSKPQDLLNEDKENESLPNLAPPQFYELRGLCRFSTLDDLKFEAYQRNYSNCDRKRFLPAMMHIKDGRLFVLPGDHLYPECPDDWSACAIDLTLEEAVTLVGQPKHRMVYHKGDLATRHLIQNIKHPFYKH